MQVCEACTIKKMWYMAFGWQCASPIHFSENSNFSQTWNVGTNWSFMVKNSQSDFTMPLVARLRQRNAISLPREPFTARKFQVAIGSLTVVRHREERGSESSSWLILQTAILKLLKFSPAIKLLTTFTWTPQHCELIRRNSWRTTTLQLSSGMIGVEATLSF